mgnify:CR=1 FL=1
MFMQWRRRLQRYVRFWRLWGGGTQDQFYVHRKRGHSFLLLFHSYEDPDQEARE